MTCDEPACPFVTGLNNLESNTNICLQAFGLSADQIDANIAAANARYGGADKFNGQRIFFLNGRVDPWSANSIVVSPAGSVEEPTFWVNDTAHHVSWRLIEFVYFLSPNFFLTFSVLDTRAEEHR